MSFINVKLERRFSEKSVFLAEIANEQTCIFESQIFIDLSFQSGFKIVRTVSHFNSDCDLNKPTP